MYYTRSAARKAAQMSAERATPEQSEGPNCTNAQEPKTCYVYHEPEIYQTVARGFRHIDSRRYSPTEPRGILPTANVSHILPASGLIKTHKEMTADWRESTEYVGQKVFFANKLLPLRTLHLNNAISLGIGSFSAITDDSVGEYIQGNRNRRRSMAQLIAFESFLEILALQHDIHPEIVFQEPLFTEEDVEFLTGLGYKVVDNPDGLDMITENTFLFAPGILWIVEAVALDIAHPSLYMTTGQLTMKSEALRQESDPDLPLVPVVSLTRRRIQRAFLNKRKLAIAPSMYAMSTELVSEHPHMCVYFKPDNEDDVEQPVFDVEEEDPETWTYVEHIPFRAR